METPPPSTTNDAVSSAVKKPQPIPWTHQETVNLIRAYQEKWYSLKRGPLRSSQWEEVAVVVAARCGYDFTHPSKSALQCRHKIEKLRQRHRAEKQRPAARPWQYLSLMDDLERGPLPISAQPLASLAPHIKEDEEDEYEIEHGDDDDDDYDIDRVNYMKSRSMNYILKQRSTPSATKNRVFNNWDDADADYDDDHDDDEEEEEGLGVSEDGLVLGLTEEIKAFGERFIGLENLKMEMMKETQRFRLEMEKKRIRMILESQRRVIDSIGRAFGSSSKRMKITRPS